MPTRTDPMLLALDNLSPTLQWVGFIATLAGAWLAWWAWWRAKGAHEQARLATEAAICLGRVAQLSDLIADMRELQEMLARGDLPAVAAKCQHLRGRVVRFKAEAYTELTDVERQNLDLARRHLEEMGDVAAVGRGKETRRIGRIQLAYGKANEALNRVFAMHRLTARGD